MRPALLHCFTLTLMILSMNAAKLAAKMAVLSDREVQEAPKGLPRGCFIVMQRASLLELADAQSIKYLTHARRSSSPLTAPSCPQSSSCACLTGHSILVSTLLCCCMMPDQT